MISSSTLLRKISAQGIAALTNDPIVIIDTLLDARLLLVTSGGSISAFDGVALRRSYQGDFQVYGGGPYHNGHLLSTSKGLFYYTDRKGQWLGQLPLQALDWIAHRGQLYVLSDRSLYTLIGDQLLPVDVVQSDPWLRYARRLLVHNAQLYIVTDSGLLAYVDGSLERAHTVQGLNDVIVYDDKLLAATDQGLVLLSASGTRAMVLGGKVFSGPISAIARTGAGSFSFSTDNATYHWSSEAYALEQVGQASSHLTAIIDTWGSLWLGDDARLYSISNTQVSEPPRLTITAMSAGGATTPQTSTIRLRHDEADVDLSYRVVHLHQPDVTVTYTTDNGATWLPADIQRLRLTDLASGRYTVILRATTDGRYYSYTQPLTIYVADAPYPWWLIGLLLAALIALLIALLSLRSARRVGHLAEVSRDKALAEQTAIRQEQKALQLQMNPHFLFNALASIQGLLASGKPGEASDMLGTYGRFMRRVLDTSRQEWYPLDDELNLLADYIKLEQMCHGGDFDYELDCPSDLLEDDIMVLPMILQPFVENAIEHGVTKTDRPGWIRIYVTPLPEASYLHVRILDNGPGLGLSQQSAHTSHGLQVVRDRLSVYGGHYDMDTSEAGVSVDIKLPVR